MRRPDRPGVRVRIYGLLEARLQSIDRVVLGGLVEGVWPPETRSDPWLSRPMRRTLGLDLPERRISLSAHDFAQMLGAGEVVLAYPAKLVGRADGALALHPAAGGGRRRDALGGGARSAARRYLGWARELDRPDATPRPVPRPEPKPARDARPTSLSVTEIETWLRDPYSIYARHILRLQPLDAIDTPPGARDRGTVIHGAIGEFTTQFKDALPQRRRRRADQARRGGIRRARGFSRGARVLVAALPAHRALVRRFRDAPPRQRRPASARRSARKLEIPLGHRTFTLRTRADRIEHLRDGSYAILDYKTGRPPTAPQVSSGLTPQLTLEGAILRAGQFEGIPAGASIAELIYVALRGGEPRRR